MNTKRLMGDLANWVAPDLGSFLGLPATPKGWHPDYYTLLDETPPYLRVSATGVNTAQVAVLFERVNVILTTGLRSGQVLVACGPIALTGIQIIGFNRYLLKHNNATFSWRLAEQGSATTVYQCSAVIPLVGLTSERFSQVCVAVADEWVTVVSELF